MTIDRKIPPRIKLPVEFELRLPECRSFSLSNGVQVYALDMGSEDVLMLNWVFYAGNHFEKQNTIAPAVNYLLKNGTSTRTAYQIEESVDFYGAYLNRACYNETAELVLHTLSRHVGELLPVVADILTDAVFPEEEIKIYAQNAIQKLKIGLQKSDFVAGRIIDAKLFGKEHPYGKYSNIEDYEAIARPQLLSFYNQYYKNGHCVIFVAGKLPPDLEEQLEKHFGGLPLKPHTTVAIPEKKIQPATEKVEHIMNDPNGVQASIRIGRNFPNRHHPDFIPMLVLNNVLGGFFGSRLMANIREEKGYTYGIYSYLVNHIQESGLMISTEAGRDVMNATIEEVFKELERLQNELIDKEELDITRNYMIGSILGDLDGPFQVIGRWKNLILNELTEEFFYKSLETIKTIKAEELKKIAEKYFVKDDFYQLTVI